jgi:hypothetical protein
MQVRPWARRSVPLPAKRFFYSFFITKVIGHIGISMKANQPHNRLLHGFSKPARR